MAETLGSLCDKLTVVDLKIWHSTDARRLESLREQKSSLQAEIDEFLRAAFTVAIPPARLVFNANKVYKKRGNAVAEVNGTMGEVFSQLARANCAVWHEQEKVYEFDKVPDSAKGAVIKKLAVLNLERNKCMEALDHILLEHVEASLRRLKKKAQRRRSRAPG